MTVSIIIPTYNYGKYLKQSLDSVLAQDYAEYEIILIDDGSTDDTSEIGKAYAEKHTHLKYIRNRVNSGIIDSVNIGMKASGGAYFHFFGSDDLYLPGFLSQSMHAFKNHPSLKLVFSDVTYFPDNLEFSHQGKRIKSKTQATLFSPEKLIETCRLHGFQVVGTTCIVKREYVESNGGFDPCLANLCDWYLFHKIALSEGVGYIPETLIAMRQHPETFTSRVKRNKKRRRATYHHLLNILRNDKTLRCQFQQARLLDFIFRELKWKLYLNPKYACYW